MRKPFLAHSVNISASISKPLASSSKRRIASLRYAQNHVHTSLMRAPNSAHARSERGCSPRRPICCRLLSSVASNCSISQKPRNRDNFNYLNDTQEVPF